MKASELIARCLENEGVRYGFGVPGEEVLDIVDSLADSAWPRCSRRRWPGRVLHVDVPVNYRENPELTGPLGQLVCPI